MAEELGYQPNAMAVALARQRGPAAPEAGIRAELAWLNHWREPAGLFRFQEFIRLWEGARAAAEALGYRLVEFVVDDRMSFKRVDHILQSRAIPGILVPPHGGAAVTCPDRHSLDWSRYAVVRIGYSIPALPAHVAVSNHTRGTLLACERIAAHGYTRVGYVCACATSALSRAGYLTYQADRSEAERLPILFLPGVTEADRVTRLARLREWWAAHRPDAILSEVGDLRALLAELGLEVPRDVALAATSVLDGNAEAGLDQHSDLVGEAGIRMLIDLVHHHECGLPLQPRELLVPSSWQNGPSLPALADARARPIQPGPALSVPQKPV